MFGLSECIGSSIQEALQTILLNHYKREERNIEEESKQKEQSQTPMNPVLY